MPANFQYVAPMTGAQAAAIAAARSPFGQNPSVKPKGCPGINSQFPTGTSPVFVQGYGWTCKENGTAAQIAVANLPSEERQTAASGDPLTQYGSRITGYKAKQAAIAELAALQKQYPSDGFQLYYYRGAYTLYPGSQVKKLQASSGGPYGTRIG